MNRITRVVLVVPALAFGLALAGCGTFDPTDIFSADIFNSKKKLPGERKPVFPEGTPGVPQGVPQELVKGYEPPPEPSTVQAATEPEEPKPAPKAKPKPKRKPKVAAKPPEDSQPTAVTVRPSGSPPPATQWPDPPKAQQPAAAPWPASPQQPAPQVAWPDPPAPNSFSR
jgi:hypothetical protein